MEHAEKKGCTFGSNSYSDDAQLCVEGKCMLCHDGEWQETEELFPPKKSGILSP